MAHPVKNHPTAALGTLDHARQRDAHVYRPPPTTPRFGVFPFRPYRRHLLFPNSVCCCAARFDEVGDGKATLTYSSLASGFHRGEVCAT